MQLKRIKRKTFYKLFIGLLMKKGKKTKAQNILNKSFQRFTKKTNLPTTAALKNIVKHLGNILEVKKVRIGRNIKTVPFPIKKGRQKFNIIRNFVGAISKDKKLKVPFYEKVSTEIINITIKFDNKTRHIKNNLNLEIVKNRANAHYRW